MRTEVCEGYRGDVAERRGGTDLFERSRCLDSGIDRDMEHGPKSRLTFSRPSGTTRCVKGALKRRPPQAVSWTLDDYLLLNRKPNPGSRPWLPDDRFAVASRCNLKVLS